MADRCAAHAFTLLISSSKLKVGPARKVDVKKFNSNIMM